MEGINEFLNDISGELTGRGHIVLLIKIKVKSMLQQHLLKVIFMIIYVHIPMKILDILKMTS